MNFIHILQYNIVTHDTLTYYIAFVNYMNFKRYIKQHIKYYDALDHIYTWINKLYICPSIAILVNLL